VLVKADTILVQDTEPIVGTVDDEIVMLSVRAGACFGFNDIGSEIWQMLAEPRRVNQLCESLKHTYEVDMDIIVHDVLPFLEALLKRHLLRVIEPGEIQ
jgi:Coenzyme PQQ synthesis protein D (PqqD)